MIRFEGSNRLRKSRQKHSRAQVRYGQYCDCAAPCPRCNPAWQAKMVRLLKTRRAPDA